jgi:hypothetical protein
VKSILYKIKYQYTEEDIYNYLKGSEKEWDNKKLLTLQQVTKF